MNIRKSELPGIGKKFEMIAINDEKREIYHYDNEDHEESVSSVMMSDEEARQLELLI